MSGSVQNRAAWLKSLPIQDPKLTYIPMKEWSWYYDDFHNWKMDDHMIVTGKYYWGLLSFLGYITSNIRNCIYTLTITHFKSWEYEQAFRRFL